MKHKIHLLKIIAGIFTVAVLCTSIIILKKVSLHTYLFDTIQTNYELDNLLSEEEGKYVCIDLRDSQEYENGHIPKFINIPFDDNGEKLLKFLQKKGYANKTIVLICYKGTRSAKAFEVLAVNGYKSIMDYSKGYTFYIENVGNEFIPEIGDCGCSDYLDLKNSNNK